MLRDTIKKINKKVWKTNRNKKNQDQIWYKNKMMRDEIKKIEKIIKKQIKITRIRIKFNIKTEKNPMLRDKFFLKKSKQNK